MTLFSLAAGGCKCQKSHIHYRLHLMKIEEESNLWGLLMYPDDQEITVTIQSYYHASSAQDKSLGISPYIIAE